MQSPENPGPAAGPTPDSEVEVRLYTSASTIGNSGRGGWAFILEHLPTGKRKSSSGGEADTTNHRMELIAVIRGLEALKKPCRVEVITGSDYVVKGLNERLASWKAFGWRRGPKSQTLVRNLDLWQRLAELCSHHEVRSTRRNLPAGHAEYETCHRMAVEARGG